MVVTRRNFISIAAATAATTALSASAFSLLGCSGTGSGAGANSDTGANSAGANTTTATFTAQPEDRDLYGSADACNVRVGSVIGPPAMGLSQFILAAQNGLTFNDFSFNFDYAVDYQALSAAFNQGDFDICVMPSNIGPILYNNNELKNEYQVISVNNLGVLYVMTTDPNIATFEDLAGRTVYAYGAGGTPEYTIEALLKKNGLDGTFNLEFKSTPFEILNLMQQEENCVAILPQPFVSLSKIMVNDLYIPIDITVEWNKAFADTGSQAVTTITCVNKAFLEEHEQAVVEYLNMVGQSIDWTLDNMSDAAALQEELGTFLNNEVALDAMPYISMTCITGVPMRTALSGFLDELYAANPDSIGGAIPDDGFYYLPPIGQIDDEEVGVEEASNGREESELA